MEEFKKSLFESEHEIKFPDYSTLTASECQDLQSKIKGKYNFNTDLEFFSRQIYFKETDALQDFNLLSLLENLNLNSLPMVYINWDRFTKIDLININDLCKYFYDIWFPIADDIDVFDMTLDWIISIRHHGAIYYTRRNRK